MTKFEGIIPAILTPFNEDGSIFEQGIKNELDYLHSHGYRNVFVCGSYGSFPVMTTEEREFVAKYVVDYCKKIKMKTIIHIGSTSTEIAVRLAKHAEDAGADAITSVVPFYYSSTFYRGENFLRYFEEIIKNVSIDVHCYNNPNTTGFNISPSFLKKLIDIGIRGMKDGGSNMGRMLEMLNVIKEKNCVFDYYPSSTASLVVGFMLGVNSCVSGVALTFPKPVMKIYESMISNNIAAALHLYPKVMKVRSILGEKGGRAITAYDVLNKRGVNVGTCKAPWQRLSQDDAMWVFEELKKTGVYDNGKLFEGYKFGTSNRL